MYSLYMYDLQEDVSKLEVYVYCIYVDVKNVFDVFQFFNKNAFLTVFFYLYRLSYFPVVKLLILLNLLNSEITRLSFQ